MASFPQGFSARTVAPQGNTSQLPASPPEGWPVVITASEMKPTAADPQAGFLECNLHIIEGEHTGLEGKYRLNIFSKSEKAVEIANRQLSALCHVCNNPDAVDSSQLHNIPFRVVVGFQKMTSPDGPQYTEVKGVKHMDGSDPGKAGSAPAAAPAPPAPPQQQAAPVQQQAAPAAAPAWGAPAQPTAPAPAAPQWGAPAAAQPAPAQAQPAWAAPQQAAPAAAPPWAAK